MQRVGLMIKHNYLQFSFQQSITFAPFFLCPFLPLSLSLGILHSIFNPDLTCFFMSLKIPKFLLSLVLKGKLPFKTN